MPAEAEFQLGAVERRLIELLFGLPCEIVAR